MRKSVLLTLGIALLCLSFACALEVPAVRSATHPNQNEWESTRAPFFSWDPVDGATGYSFTLDQSNDSTPAEPCENVTTKQFSSKADGSYYFHIMACAGSALSSVAHYGVKIDGSGPSMPLNPKATPREDGGLELAWDASEDALAGVAGYEIFKGYILGFDIRTTEGWLLAGYEDVAENHYTDVNNMHEGVTYHYRVRAVDNAGNRGKLSLEFWGRTLTFCDLNIAISVTEQDNNLSIAATVESDSMRKAYLKITPPGGEAVVLDEGNRITKLDGSYDLNSVSDGSILISVESEDGSGDRCDKNSFFVLDRAQPTIEWLNPTGNSKIGGEGRLSVEAEDTGINPSGLASIKFLYKNESAWQSIATLTEGEGKMYYYDWNTLEAPNGRLSLKAVATDQVGNNAYREITVTIENLGAEKDAAEFAVSNTTKRQQEAAERIAVLKEKNIPHETLDSIIRAADSNAAEAKTLLRTGKQYAASKKVAEQASELYRQAIESVQYSLYQTAKYSYSKRKLESKLREAGLAEKLIDEGEGLITALDVNRELEILEIADSVKGKYYLANITISMHNSTDQNLSIQLIELVPKELTENASEIVCTAEFEVIEPDPVIRAYLGTLAQGESLRFTYGLGVALSKEDADSIMADKVIEDFAVPPIILNKERDISSSFTFTERSFDLAALISGILPAEALGNGPFAAIGLAIVALLAIAILALLVIIAFLFMRKQREQGKF